MAQKAETKVFGPPYYFLSVIFLFASNASNPKYTALSITATN
jgi:hypothetical protein